MALLDIQFESQTLARKQRVHVMLPDTDPPLADGRYPALWLFHGQIGRAHV
mgnify:CR=1 FL=1